MENKNRRIRLRSAKCCYGYLIARHQGLCRLHKAAPLYLQTACRTCSVTVLKIESDSSLPCACDSLMSISVQVLIIDEISMVSAEMFYMLDCQLQAVRDSSKPFGGLQIILAGDFYQCARSHLAVHCSDTIYLWPLPYTVT